MKTRKLFAALLAAALLLSLAACGEEETPSLPDDAPGKDPVTLTIAGPWEDCIAVDAIEQAFVKDYPNVKINYEYIQDYNENVIKRMEGDTPIDIFLPAGSIKPDSDFYPYALDLKTREDLDLSQTFPGLIDNFTYYDEGSAEPHLCSIPVGGEMRGLYVNVTLLNYLNIAVPTNQAELLAACKVLKENGYFPFQGNPGDFGQTLIYPWISNIVANAEDYDAVYSRIANKEDGVSELFREPFEFIYTLVENDYYDYKTVEKELGLFSSAAVPDYARYFLNIIDDQKVDDLGLVAFMPSPLSSKGTIDQVKEDYHSEIEYVFIPAPVGTDGGYVYLSCARGIAINKNSKNLDWSVKFFDFLFEPENNTIFAEAFNVIPNSADTLSYVSSLYQLPADRICELGQVSFDYGFYGIMRDNLVDVSKANAPKYMQEDPNGDTDFEQEDGTVVKVSMYPFSHYMELLEASFHAE